MIRKVNDVATEVLENAPGGIDEDTFTTLQVHLRRLHDLRYKLYNNGMLLKDFYGNQVREYLQ